MGALDLVVGALLLWAIWVALPMRWMPVDAGGTLLAVALLAAGAGLLARAPWAERVARAVAAIALVVGGTFTLALAFTAGHLRGVYGAIGNCGAIILAIVVRARVPYLVVFPAWKLWARRGTGTGTGTETEPETRTETGTETGTGTETESRP